MAARVPPTPASTRPEDVDRPEPLLSTVVLRSHLREGRSSTKPMSKVENPFSEKSVGPPATRQGLELEAESEPDTEIIFSPRIVGPFDSTSEMISNYPLPSQREAVIEASLERQAEPQTHTLPVASTSRTHQEPSNTATFSLNK